jgi:hypothetical protein
MDPNWSSGSRSGNKDRVQIVKPASLGKWVDRKTPKDVFKPPSAPYNPKLRKQKYNPSAIYKAGEETTTDPTATGPIPKSSTEPSDGMPSLMDSSSGSNMDLYYSPRESSSDSYGLNGLYDQESGRDVSMDSEPSADSRRSSSTWTTLDRLYNTYIGKQSIYDSADLLSTNESTEQINNVVAEINEASNEMKEVEVSSMLVSKPVNILNDATSNTIVVGPTLTNVESEIPAPAVSTGPQYYAGMGNYRNTSVGEKRKGDTFTMRNRLTDTDRIAVDRVYVPKPRTRGSTVSKSIQNNPAFPDLPVAKYHDFTTVIVKDEKGVVLLNDKPENISTVDVIEASQNAVGSLKVETDKQEPFVWKAPENLTPELTTPPPLGLLPDLPSVITPPPDRPKVPVPTASGEIKQEEQTKSAYDPFKYISPPKLQENEFRASGPDEFNKHYLAAMEAFNKQPKYDFRKAKKEFEATTNRGRQKDRKIKIKNRAADDERFTPNTNKLAAELAAELMDEVIKEQIEEIYNETIDFLKAEENADNALINNTAAMIETASQNLNTLSRSNSKESLQIKAETTESIAEALENVIDVVPESSKRPLRAAAEASKMASVLQLEIMAAVPTPGPRSEASYTPSSTPTSDSRKSSSSSVRSQRNDSKVAENLLITSALQTRRRRMREDDDEDNDGGW